jgi:hypothetical protein
VRISLRIRPVDHFAGNTFLPSFHTRSWPLGVTCTLRLARFDATPTQTLPRSSLALADTFAGPNKKPESVIVGTIAVITPSPVSPSRGG